MSIAKPRADVIKPSLIESLRRRSKNIMKANSSAAADKIVRKVDGGSVSMKRSGVTSDGLTVATVTVATTGVTPSEGVTDEGETVQVDIAGAPLHASATAALNPPDGVTVKWNETVSPRETVTVVGDAVSVKFGLIPVPLNASACIPGAAVSVITRLAVSTAATEGVNRTLMVQDAFTAMLPAHVELLE